MVFVEKAGKTGGLVWEKSKYSECPGLPEMEKSSDK